MPDGSTITLQRGQLADLAGISPEAAINATRRLCCSGLLYLVRVWVADCANIYRLKSQSMTLPQYTLEEVVRVWDGMKIQDGRLFGDNSARCFSLWRRVNKSAGEVYWWLTQAPMTDSELIQTNRTE